MAQTTPTHTAAFEHSSNAKVGEGVGVCQQEWGALNMPRNHTCATCPVLVALLVSHPEWGKGVHVLPPTCFLGAGAAVSSAPGKA